MKKGTLVFVGVVLSLIILVNIGSALTGKIGNARAILNAETGDTIDRTIKVINDNEVPVAIELFASGDLADDVTIIDNDFTLQPGEEKDARFTIYVSQAGTTETNVNVKFTAIGEKQGVGMSSTLIIKAEDTGFFDGLFGGNDEDTDSVTGTGEATADNSPSSGTSPSTLLVIVIILAVILVFLILILLALSKQRKKKGRRTKRKKSVRKR